MRKEPKNLSTELKRERESFYQAIKDKERNRRKLYYQANKEKLLAQSLQYRIHNREFLRKQDKLRRIRKREERIEADDKAFDKYMKDCIGL